MTTAPATAQTGEPVVPVDALVSITRETWEAFVGDADALLELPLPPAGETVTGCVTVTGGWTGSVTLTLSEALARRVAGALFGSEPADLSAEEVSDAVGELTNVVGGAVKGMVPGPSQLSIPAVTSGAHVAVRLPGAVPVSAADLAHEGEPLVVTVWEG